MAKRFTDADKWKKAWFRTLSPTLKLLWNYICENCDHAGIWSEDYELASFQIGISVTREMAIEAFGDRLIRLRSDKVFLPAFIEFQYGTLRSDSKPHASVIKILTSEGIDPVSLRVCKQFPRSMGTPKDKNKDQDKNQDQDQDQEKEEGGLGEETNSPAFDFEALYRKYPRKEGKSKGLLQCEKQIDSQAKFELLGRAIERYAKHCLTTGQLVMHFSSFLGTSKTGFPWRDWSEPETGHGAAPAQSSQTRAQQISAANQAQAERILKGEL